LKRRGEERRREEKIPFLVFLFFNLHKTILFTRSVMAPSKLNSTVIPLLSPSLSINNYILDFDLLCSVG
jgi:hypothetical protein